MNSLPVLLQIALRISGLSLVAVGGGNALLPALHDQSVTSMHWLSDADFTELVALSQSAPGPNMLVIPLIGLRSAGIAGAAIALVAFLLPSATLAIIGSRFIVRHEGSNVVAALRWALRPVSAGLLLSSSGVLVTTAARTWPWPSSGVTPGAVTLAVVAAFLSLRYKTNPIVFLAAAALFGALL